MLTDTLYALYKALEADNEDWLTYSALADWYEDHNEYGKSEVIRWQIANSKRCWDTLQNLRNVRFVWSNVKTGTSTTKSSLPNTLFTSLKNHNRLYYENKYYGTFREAQEALYEAYREAKASGWNPSSDSINPPIQSKR